MNNDKISKASNVRKPHPVYMLISEGLSSIDQLNEGCGGKIVEAVVKSVPKDWKIVVFMDWNHGFWESMVKKYPRVIVF